MNRLVAMIGVLGICQSAVPATQAPPKPADDADLFGALNAVTSAELSADGKRLVVVGPTTGADTRAAVIDVTGGNPRTVARAEGPETSLTNCGWSGPERVVCAIYGITRVLDYRMPFLRTLAVDIDGKKVLPLGQRDSLVQQSRRLWDGYIIDWLNGVDGKVLMMRTNVPEHGSGKLTARKDEGLGVDLIDTYTGKATVVERPRQSARQFFSDGRGNIRILSLVDVGVEYQATGITRHQYRTAQGEWQELGRNDADDKGMTPLAVEPVSNTAYFLQPLDGRKALHRIALDGSLKTELVYASKEVDVDNVVVVGRGGRVIGATYVTDYRHVEYFDPEYRRLSESLRGALKLTTHFVSASANERVLLLYASSDTEPGHYYVFDRDRNTVTEVLNDRPGLKGRKLSRMRPITYPASDGTQIPAYLTLPPGVEDPRGLPALVMPHGGPSSRDEWGFDWLSQYFAQRGFIVLQPNYRGSAGFGEKWYLENGFRSWRTSIGDVVDAGRWLVAQGMAAPSRLGIFGWSYGGYAALQVNALDADLFKAVVAVAPVTDLAQLKEQYRYTSNRRIASQFIGYGQQVEDGSPYEHPEVFKAPVLMFHGTEDINVDILQSQRMDKALRAAGKSTELIVYPKLEHSLVDSTVRADLLRRSDAFLRKHLGL
jgi:acetyl esterase/lipase